MNIKVEEKRFMDGAKVRINTKRIMQEPDYDRRNPEYKAFVEGSRGKVFTVRREGRFCGLKELGEGSWLFWDGDLVPALNRRQRRAG